MKKLLLMLFAFASFAMQANARVLFTHLNSTKPSGNESAPYLIDGNASTKWGQGMGNGETKWIIFKAAAPVKATSYTLTIANDTNGQKGRNWQKWRIFGANFICDAQAAYGATGWVLLDTKSSIGEDEFPTANQYQATDFLMSEGVNQFFQYFMICVDEIRTSGQYMQMGEFAFKDYTYDVSNYLNLNYTDGIDSDLTTPYASKLADLTNALEGTEDQIMAAANAIMPIYNKIVSLQNGYYTALEWSSAWGDGPGSNLVDKNEDSKWGGSFPSENNVEHVQYVVFRSLNQQPYFYKLVTGGDTERWYTRNWKSWKVFGGNFASEADAKRDATSGWVLLDERQNVGEDYLPIKNKYPAALGFSKGISTAYSYYKVEVTASGGDQQQMAELYLCSQADIETIRLPWVQEFAEFYAGLNDMVIDSDIESERTAFAQKYQRLQETYVVDEMTQLHNELKAIKADLEASVEFMQGKGYWPYYGNTGATTENHAKLVDGNINTKWCGSLPLAKEATDTEPAEPAGSYVVFKIQEAKTFGQYKLVTGNDTKNTGRNWRKWRIYGCNVTDPATATRDYDGWTLLDLKDEIGPDRLPAENFTNAFFNLSEEWTTDYRYFKVEVDSAYSSGPTQLIQMSEFKFLTDAEYASARQEYVDSLQKVALAKLAEFSGMSVPDAVMQAIQTAAMAKVTAVTTATADDLLPAFNDALNFINVEAPALVAASQLSQVDGVYQIGNAMQLVSFASLVNAGEVAADAVLVDNIDMTGVAWSAPIGNWGSNQIAYKGHFDGQGHAITNFTYTTNQEYHGLFGVISTGALIENFSIAGTITNPANSQLGVVGFARDDNPTIRNVKSALNINNSRLGARIGGILGVSYSGSTVNVDRCTYSGIIDGNDNQGNGNYGGMVGYTQNAATTYCNVTNCLFDGKLINTAATPGNCTFGGMVGYVGANPSVAIKNCLSIGTVQSAVTGQFYGAVKSAKCSLVNSYYQGANVNGSASTVTLTGAVEVTDEQLANGYVACKLAPAFRQNLGTDAYPELNKAKPFVAEITEYGYATLYQEETDALIPDDVEVFAGVVEGVKVTLNAIETAFAAEEPVILKGNEGYYMFRPTTGVEKVAANDLKGAAQDVTCDGSQYVLAQPEGEKIAFYKATEGVIKAGKAYIEHAGSGVKALYFDWDDPTGISNIEVASENGAIYNVAGQRLSKVQKGINIVSGKKVLK